MPEQEHFPRPNWKEAAVWLGADFFTLWRILLRNGFRVSPVCVADCSIDVLVSVINTALTALQSFYWGARIGRIELPDDPIFIIGHWRTGTTLLHELLALDPRNRCPTTYECFSPNHFLLSEPLVAGWLGYTLPARRPSDNMAMGWDKPQEDEFALCNMGVPSPYATMAFPNQPPQFQEYLELDEVSPPQRRRWERAFQTFLKQLLLKRPGRLVLKSPPHTFRLPVLVRMFPRARFIHMRRDPYAVFSSTVRLWKSLYAWQGYQLPTYEGLEEYVLDTFVRMHKRLETTRGLVDPARFHELRYEDLLRDPQGQTAAIYERFSLGGFDELRPKIAEYFRQRADYQTNRHELTPELREKIARRWGPWLDKQG
jgi:omega-hydroxy-beta-dihydromenaquinone-9 sulfotransferase